jgi:hypothetical protein
MNNMRKEDEPMMEQQTGIARMLDMIRAEYKEMPGMSLTRSQIRRLWNLESVTCDAVVDALERARELRRTATGAYVAGEARS